MSSAMGWTALGRDSLLLPSALRELGYRTAIVGKLHLNPRTCLRHHTTGGPFGCGFDHQYGFVGGMSDYWDHHHTWSRDGKRLREQGYMTTLLAAEAERLIHAHAGGQHGNMSLFLWLSLNAPHVPLQAPDEWIERQPTSIADPQVRTYAAMVAAMDDAFGRAVSAFRTTGMLSSTLIIFASDNGGPIIPAACNGGLRGGKGSPFEGGVRAPAFVYWPACLGSGISNSDGEEDARGQDVVMQRAPLRVSRVSAHMVDLFSTILIAAASRGVSSSSSRDGGGAAHKLLPRNATRLFSRLQKKSPHSVSLWGALAAAATYGGEKAGRALAASTPALGPAEPPELARRLLVLQVSASSSSVMRGRWKLVLANKRCFGTPAEVPHDTSMRGFPADRWLLHELAEGDGMGLHGAGATSTRSSTIGGGTHHHHHHHTHHRNRTSRSVSGGLASLVGRRLAATPKPLPSGAARLSAARKLGVDLQLYDLHADPSEAHDLLGGLTRGVSSRNETHVASAMLGHYLAAVRLGRRSIERAYEEKRVNRGGVMVLWFCRQVEYSWTLERWSAAHNMMCYGRTKAERKQLVGVPPAERPLHHLPAPKPTTEASSSAGAKNGKTTRRRKHTHASHKGVN